MEYVFGPVPSKRLGQSLGVDTIPLKTCNWNCVYCQLGRTRPITAQRREYYPTEKVAAEIREALETHRPGEIDWVTFVGSGEPTLHIGIGQLIQEAKRASDLPVAVITNGSLLYLPEVREALTPADAVMPTLDAGAPELYKRINRPHPTFTFQRLVDGLTDFRRVFAGKLWVEVMLVRGMNDTEEALTQIAHVMRQIQPDEIHISLPDRPPVEPWVQPPDQSSILLAAAVLGSVARVLSPAVGAFDLGPYGDPIEAILHIITRHPMRQEQLEAALEEWMPGHAAEALAQLEASGQAQVVERHGVRFWNAASSHFPTQ
jgi:wyosine [tRNA(Phe)-imidazoG37] synthetase (radical SAM superfamily)